MRQLGQFICVSVFMLFVSVPSAPAQILVERSNIRMTVAPGETVTDAMYVHNTSLEPISLKLYWQDFMYIAPFNGDKAYYPAGTSPHSMSSWVSFSPREITIDPQTKRKLNYSFAAPPDAEGGYYGVLFLENTDRNQRTDTGVTIVTRLGSLFFIEIEGADRSADIVDIAVDGDRLTATFQNHGNVVLFPEGVYYIMDGEGGVSDRGSVEKMYLPPDESAEFSVTLPEDLAAGAYTIVMTFDLQNRTSKVKEIDITKSAGGAVRVDALRD